MVAADGEAVTVAAEKKNIQIRPGQADAASQGDGAAMNEVRAVTVHEIWETRGTTDPGDGDDLFLIDLAFLQNLVIRSQDGEVAAAGAPGGVIGRDRLLG